MWDSLKEPSEMAVWVMLNTELEQAICDMQIKTTETTHNEKSEMTACTDGIVTVGRLQKCGRK